MLPFVRNDMKRSEMLNEISYVIRENDLDTSKELAEKILKVIEDKGMLPPYVDYGRLTKFGRGCKWEPENEEES